MLAEVFVASVNAIPRVFEWSAVGTVFGLAPLAILRRTRAVSAIGLIVATVLFSLILWASSALTVYVHWGLSALLFSILVAGIGVVPAAYLAVFTNGTQHEFIGLMAMTFMVVVSGGGASFLLAD